MTKQELEPILDQLIALGEDAEELNYWRSIFDDLPADKQEEVCLLFKAELHELQEAEQAASETPTAPTAPATDTSQTTT